MNTPMQAAINEIRQLHRPYLKALAAMQDRLAALIIKTTKENTQ